MAPKAKAKAKGKAGADDGDSKIPVPPPPPTPVLVKFPESFTSQDPASRCALLAWRDKEAQYKLQCRSFTKEDRDLEAGWEDAEQVKEQTIAGRGGVWLVSHLQSVRLEFRLALKGDAQKIEDRFVANWFSAPSDPAFALVDPPIKPQAVALARGDYCGIGVQLTFGSTNPDFARSKEVDPGVTDLGPWASFPGLGISRCQARWRVIRRASSAEIMEMGADAASAEKFAQGADDGTKRAGPLVEVGPGVCAFDTYKGTWSYVFGDVPHGLVVRFEVRIGTTYRWSPWSEESDDVDVAVPPPRPQEAPGEEGVVEITSTTDSTAHVRWDPFSLADGLTLCEYRIMVCQLSTPEGDGTKLVWDGKSAYVAGMFTVETSEDKKQVEYQIKGLIPDSFYIVRVDARYPFVCERGWSVASMTAEAVGTRFAVRPPPLAPMALPTDELEVIVQAGEGKEASLPFADDMPWLALLIEASSYEDYRIEYLTADASEGAANQVWVPAEETVQLGVADIDRIGSSGPKKVQWTAVSVLLRGSTDWNQEAVVCRLRHKHPASISPLLGTGSTSSSLVPNIRKPVGFSAKMAWSSDIQRFAFQARFYLGSAAPSHGEYVGGLSSLGVAGAVQRSATEALARSNSREQEAAAGTQVHLVGHRFVTHVQLRVRQVSPPTASSPEDGHGSPPRPPSDGEPSSPSTPWRLLPRRPLPRALPHSSSQGAPPLQFEGALAEMAALLWDLGDRHEVWLEASDGIEPTASYEVGLRVGTSTRWSLWATAEGPVTFSIPAPNPSRPGREREMKLTCSSTSATSATLRFPPFMLSPGAGAAEYLARAAPLFVEADRNGDDMAEGNSEDDLEMAADIKKDLDAGAEGGRPVHKTVVLRHRALRTDVEMAQAIVERNGLAEVQDAAQLADLVKQERDADINTAADEAMVEIPLPGLLPATRYEVTVSARYPGISGAMDSTTLTEVFETPCGAAPPLAPLLVSFAQASSEGVSLCSRAVVLELEDRPEYVLECRGVSAEGMGWYPPEGKKEKSHVAHWWNPGISSVDEWTVVPTRPLKGGQDRSSSQAARARVVAELPTFSGRTGSELPDVVRFRQRIAERQFCHPCRWVGNASEPVATCIAPLTLAPLPRRVFTCGAWHVGVAFFVHAGARPASTTVVAEARKALQADEGLEQLAEAEESATFEAEAADEEGGEDLVVPAGYGHRQVLWAQARVRLVGSCAPDGEGTELSSSSRDWIELPELPLGQCRRAKAPEAKKPKDAGDFHELALKDVERLREGGVYRVQLRVGDGRRWSPWSQASRRFAFAVPQPIATGESGDSLEVHTLSASVVRCRWSAFASPKGMKSVEYRLQAEPTEASRGKQGACTVTATHVLRADASGASLEAELSNLLPATEYMFSVAARFPHIGSRSWSAPLRSHPQMLSDSVADWPAPPSPVALPHGGPRPFVMAEEGMPFFHPNERALLVSFPDAEATNVCAGYRLEYKHVGLLDSSEDCDGIWPVDYRTVWRTPLEVVPIEGLDDSKIDVLSASTGPWKTKPQLWRIRLPGIHEGAVDGLDAAQLQRVQLRLASKQRHECPSTRWFSAPSAPLCTALAPPLEPKAGLRITDSHLGIHVAFGLDRRLAPESLRSEGGALAAKMALRRAEGRAQDGEGAPLEAESHLEEVDVPGALPRGFGHAFVQRFQVKSRHSPRPPPEDAQLSSRGRVTQGVPWSSWAESPDVGMQVATAIEASSLVDGRAMTRLSLDLSLPKGAPLEYSSWYHVSVRVSDGTCWSDWSDPSAPVKVFVAPPKPVRPDTSELAVNTHGGGGGVKLSWPLLRAHGGLRRIEYALFVREVLHDRTEICARQIAALIEGRASGESEASPEDAEGMSFELRDLRQDVTYIFSLAARYPHIGPREFSDYVLDSTPTSLRPACAPLPVPMQVPLPPERLRRMQAGRCALVRWSFEGLPRSLAEKEEDFDLDRKDGAQYDLQLLPEGARDGEWVHCKQIQRMKVDGLVAWLVKDIPARALRCRFRLWEKDTGRFGRPSPLVLSFVETVAKLSAVRVVSDATAEITLRAPLDAPHGSQAFVCRYQVRYRAESVDSSWEEMPFQMIWHQLNDHLMGLDPSVDDAGGVISGIDGAGPKVGVEPLAADVGGDSSPSGKDNMRSAVRPPSFPTMPLASVNFLGEVSRQRCLVASLREEDGLVLDQSYVFSVRVGDLHRLSEWSEPSQAAKLAVPPPLLDAGLSEEEAQIQVTGITDVGFTATWPQFTPATHASAPLHVEVEYLLVVAPKQQKARLAGSTRKIEVPPHPHSQWLLSSRALRDNATHQASPGERLRVEIAGLKPYTSYELKLSVRYARLGVRRWTDALSLIANTQKSSGVHAVAEDAPTQVASQFSASQTAGAYAPLFSTVKSDPKPRVLAVHPAKHLDTDLRESTRKAMWVGSPRMPESGRHLPPLETRALPSDPAVQIVQTADPACSAADFEEWAAAAQADSERVCGGSATVGLSIGSTRGPQEPPEPGSAEPARPGYPPRPAEHVPFWHRDPMDARPAMPSMPPAAHPAMQLDLVGRGGRPSSGGPNSARGPPPPPPRAAPGGPGSARGLGGSPARRLVT